MAMLVNCVLVTVLMVMVVGLDVSMVVVPSDGEVEAVVGAVVPDTGRIEEGLLEPEVRLNRRAIAPARALTLLHDVLYRLHQKCLSLLV